MNKLENLEQLNEIVEVISQSHQLSVNTKEIVVVETADSRTLALFCESDESFLGFLTETINQKMRPKR